jgi:transcription antitermination protein NusB
MAARSKARKRALDLLYAGEARGTSAVDLLETQIDEGELNNPYTATLVRGVVAEQARIDHVISEYSREWSLARMPAVDRNVLRIAVWELLFSEDIPAGVAVSEAVTLVQDLSTDESPSFVNGVLGAIEKDRASLV